MTGQPMRGDLVESGPDDEALPTASRHRDDVRSIDPLGVECLTRVVRELDHDPHVDRRKGRDADRFFKRVAHGCFDPREGLRADHAIGVAVPDRLVSPTRKRRRDTAILLPLILAVRRQRKAQRSGEFEAVEHAHFFDEVAIVRCRSERHDSKRTGKQQTVDEQEREDDSQAGRSFRIDHAERGRDDDGSRDRPGCGRLRRSERLPDALQVGRVVLRYQRCEERPHEFVREPEAVVKPFRQLLLRLSQDRPPR